MKVPDWSGHPRHVSSRIRCATILELRFNGSPRRGDAGALALRGRGLADARGGTALQRISLAV
jgi:hypothetical protein